jgi:hypothetical protein
MSSEPMSQAKVFGIGFQKTGTTSLGVIFDALGFRVAGYNEFRHLAQRETLEIAEVEALALEIAQGVDAVKDSPWPIFYRQLDQAFPGSKFIHVTRDPKAWIASAVNDFGDRPNALREVIYGSRAPKGNEAAWLARYTRHNQEVQAYFAGRAADYLHIRLEDGVSYEKVCDFLGLPRIGRGVPVANTRLRKKLKMIWWRLSGQR